MSEATPIQLKKFQYSSSKRKTEAQCALKYYHTYVAKTYPFKETPAVLIGKHCDTVLENAIATGADPNLVMLKEKINSLDPSYKFLDSLVEGVDAAFEYAVTRPGIRVLQKRLAMDKALKNTEVNWRGKALFDSAMFDLVTLTDDPEKVIVDDWKSGNDKYPDWDQIEDYALYMFRNLPKVQVVEGSIVWLRRGRHPQNIVHRLVKEFRRSDMRKTVQRWAGCHERVVGYNSAKVWPANPSQEAMCPWCDHCAFCDEAKEADYEPA